MIIFSIDVGRTMGFVMMRDSDLLFYEEIKFESLQKLYEVADKWITLTPPDLILIPYPTRIYNVIVMQSKLSAIIEMVAEKHNVPVILMNDKHCKKTILNNGKAQKKDIYDYYYQKYSENKLQCEIKSEHVLDAIMFAETYLADIA